MKKFTAFIFEGRLGDNPSHIRTCKDILALSYEDALDTAIRNERIDGLHVGPSTQNRNIPDCVLFNMDNTDFFVSVWLEGNK